MKLLFLKLGTVKYVNFIWFNPIFPSSSEGKRPRTMIFDLSFSPIPYIQSLRKSQLLYYQIGPESFSQHLYQAIVITTVASQLASSLQPLNSLG